MTPSSSPLDRSRRSSSTSSRVSGSKIEPVGGVVVGRDRLGVAVDHDRLEAVSARAKAAWTAAVVELDALADAVGAAAEDHHLLAVADGADSHSSPRRARGSRRSSTCRACGLELGGAGVDALEDGSTPSVCAARADLVLGLADQVGEARVGEAHAPSARRKSAASAARPSSRIRSSTSTISRCWRGTRGRYGQAALISSTLRPWRKAWAMTQRRSGVGRGRAARMTALLPVSGSSAHADVDLVETGRAPISRPRRAFCRLSGRCGRWPWPRRPISSGWSAVGSAPGNFSKAKRGILVTT